MALAKLGNKRAPREVLAAARTYYVRTDGNDANSGLVNTVGGAFLTIQKAVDVVASLDIGIYNVTIQVSSGTYTAGALVNGPWVGSGTVTLQGDTGTPANVVISVTNGNCLKVQEGGRLTATGFKLQTTTAGNGLEVDTKSVINFSAIDFGACATYHIFSNRSGSLIRATGNYGISGGAVGHALAANQGNVTFASGITVTISGTPAFSTAFVVTQRLGMLQANGVIYSGAATGSRFRAETNSLIFTNGAGPTFFPGNAAGVLLDGGQYDTLRGGARETLTANRTYYVRTDGNDNNTGLVNNAGGAFLTIQRAINVVAGLDLNTFTAIIQVAAGTYTANTYVGRPFLGGTVVVRGDTTTPANVIISTTSADCFTVLGGSLIVEGMELRTTTGGNCLYALNYGTIEFNNIRFGICAARHIRADTSATIKASPTLPYSIVGGATDHVLADHGEYVCSGSTVTLVGTPAFSVACFSFQSLGSIALFSVTFSGAATGKRYAGTSNAVLNSFGAGTASTYFPGNSNGTVATGAQQI